MENKNTTILSHKTAFEAYRVFRVNRKYNSIFSRETCAQKHFDIRKGKCGNKALESGLIKTDLIKHINSPYQILVSKQNKRHKTKYCSPHFANLPKTINHAYTILNGIAIVRPELLFIQLIQQYGIIDAILGGLKLCGKYCLYHNKLTSNLNEITLKTKIEKYLYKLKNSNNKIRYVKTAKLISKYLADGSASPQESRLYLKLALPRKLGGKGIDDLMFNYKITPPLGPTNFTNKNVLYVDLANPMKKIAIEYDSNTFHKTQDQLLADKLKIETLSHMGWKVYNFTTAESSNIKMFNEKASLISKSMGLDNAKLNPETVIRQQALFRKLA